MPLPKISTPTYELELPSTEQTIKYRPFLVREEKLLVLALETEDTKQITNAIKTVIKICIETKNIKVELLPTFDIEFLFLNIRGKSVGEEIEVNIICPDDGETTVPVKINVDDIKVQKNSEHTKRIKLDDSIMMEMKYPSLDTLQQLGSIGDGDYDKLFDVISGCIDSIYTNEEVFHTKDQTKQDVLDFLNNLTSDQFAKIQKFFETMPRLRKEISYNCPVCSKKHDKVLEGIGSFF
jgi:hypothetical protein